MDPVNLKKGMVILEDGETYLVKEVKATTKDAVRIFFVHTQRIRCGHCTGNMKKFGRPKDQYVCVECGKPAYIEG